MGSPRWHNHLVLIMPKSHISPYSARRSDAGAGQGRVTTRRDNLSAQYAMTASDVILGDVDMFAQEIADGRLVMPYDTIIEDGYGYYLKLDADDLADPAISMFRSWPTLPFRCFEAG
jgi:hypothetical protein